MQSVRSILSTTICRNEFPALVVLFSCFVGAVALIIISFRGMAIFELTQAELFLGVLLTFAVALLLMCVGALAYLIVTHAMRNEK